MRRLMLLAAASAALMLMTVAPAVADDHQTEPVVDSTEHGAWWYFDPADELVMTTGVPVGPEWCFGAQPFDGLLYSWQQPDGLWLSRVHDEGLPIFLYEGPVEDVIDGGCAAAAEGGELPHPVAVGSGSSTAIFTDQSEPWVGGGPPPVGAYIENTVRGFVAYADGSGAKVHGSAAYLVAEDGLAIDVLDITVIPLGSRRPGRTAAKAGAPTLMSSSTIATTANLLARTLSIVDPITGPPVRG